MNSLKSIVNALIVIGIVLLPAYAGVIHKWVDEKGITHYSDEAPIKSPSQISQIHLPENIKARAGAQDGYYSIANQWERMLKERLERAKLDLEHDRLKAIRREEKPDKFDDQESRDTGYIISHRGHRPHHRPFRQSSLERKHPNKRLMFRDYPPGLHPGRNLKRGIY